MGAKRGDGAKSLPPVLDSETGLYHQGLRYYDPSLGRWTQKNPLNLFQDPRQVNRYVYAGADPINLVDPSGTFALLSFVKHLPSIDLGGLFSRVKINCGTIADFYSTVSRISAYAIPITAKFTTPTGTLALLAVASGGQAYSYVFRHASDQGAC